MKTLHRRCAGLDVHQAEVAHGALHARGRARLRGALAVAPARQWIATSHPSIYAPFNFLGQNGARLVRFSVQPPLAALVGALPARVAPVRRSIRRLSMQEPFPLGRGTLESVNGDGE